MVKIFLEIQTVNGVPPNVYTNSDGHRFILVEPGYAALRVLELGPISKNKKHQMIGHLAEVDIEPKRNYLLYHRTNESDVHLLKYRGQVSHPWL